jgi:hypothetical protein
MGEADIDKEFWERVEQSENDLSWLHETKPDGSPLDELEVKMPLEPAWVTEMRTLDGGPYYVTADSGQQVPPDFYAGIDCGALPELIEASDELERETTVEPDGSLRLPEKMRERLDSSGPGGVRLLTALERGLEASSPELRKRIQERRRKEGLL